jgi:hypothetical protein
MYPQPPSDYMNNNGVFRCKTFTVLDTEKKTSNPLYHSKYSGYCKLRYERSVDAGLGVVLFFLVDQISDRSPYEPAPLGLAEDSF